jgi:drug/metabolite transporter (DMT)-like permease
MMRFEASESTSQWRRSRAWATAAFLAMALGALFTLGQGHLIHGLLMGLGAALLFKGSVFGRRGRRLKQAHDDLLTPSKSPERWREAA